MLSACLVSLEPEAHLRVFPSSFQHDDRFLKNSRHRTLITPDDTSCTHILVFPTSPELNVCFLGTFQVLFELTSTFFQNLIGNFVVSTLKVWRRKNFNFGYIVRSSYHFFEILFIL